MLDVKLYQFTASPHCIKVRLGLAFKDISYDRVEVDPEERREPLLHTGQPFVPVLQHKNTWLFDSYAILRYLEAQWPTGQFLFRRDPKTMRQIEAWENFARAEAMRPIAMILQEAFSDTPNQENLVEANRILGFCAKYVEDQLEERTFLVDHELSAADLSVAPFLYYGQLSEKVAESGPVAAFFHENLKLEGRGAVRDWVERVMALEEEKK